MTGETLAAVVLGYLLGSVPFGLVLTRLFGVGDIRQIGSGNIGATNVLRTGHKGLALATLLLDGGKGALAVLAALVAVGPEAALAAGFGAVVGHNFPVWLKFKGGKGVATTGGVLFATAWPVGLLAFATWVAVAAITRLSSLAALVAFAAAPVFAWVLAGTPYAGGATPAHAVAFAVMAALGWYRHKANIQRILKGEEPRIGAKKK